MPLFQCGISHSCFIGREKVVNAIEITREKCRLLNVYKIEKACSYTLKASCRTAMRRHSVFKCLKVKGESFWIEPSALNTLYEEIMVVNALPSCCNLESAEQYVKAFRESGVVLI